MGSVAFLAELLWRLPSALFGPVFRQDLYRMVRRSRLFLFRGGYLLMLLAALWVVYFRWFSSSALLNIVDESTVSPSLVGQLATAFTSSLIVMQLVAVFIFTPALSASAITEEKERNTLPYLLMTPLSSAEIVLGKWASRVAYLLLFLLAGLPVFALLQLLGGVDAGLMLFAFGVSACNIAGLAAVGIMCSVLSRGSGPAIFQTYALALAYQFISGVSGFCCLLSMNPSVSWPIPVAWTGNLFFLWIEVDSALTGGSTGTPLAVLFAEVAVFHALVVTFCCALAAIQLRRKSRPLERRVVALTSWPKKATTESALLMIEVAMYRPPVTDRPVLWKERHFGSIFGLGNTFDALVLSTTVPFGFMFLCGQLAIIGLDEREMAAGLTQLGETFVSWSMFLVIGINSAAMISREREQHTLDGLLVTPLSTRTILLQKLTAVFFRAFPFMWALAAIWILGLIGGGTNILFVFRSMRAIATFALFYAMLGMCLSLGCGSTVRARAWVLLILFLLVAERLSLLVVGFATQGVVHHTLDSSMNVRSERVLPFFWLATLAMWAWAEWKFGQR